MFRLKTNADIQIKLHIFKTPHPVFGFTLLGDNADFSIYVNPGQKQYPLHLPSSGRWRIVTTNTPQRQQQLIIGEYTSIGACELIVLQRSRKETSDLSVYTKET